METLCNISLETLSFVLSDHPLQLLSGVSTDTPLPLRMDSLKHFIGNIFLCCFCLFTATKKWGQHRHASATKDGNSLRHCIGNTFLCSFSLNQGTEAFHRDDAAKGQTCCSVCPWKVPPASMVRAETVPVRFHVVSATHEPEIVQPQSSARPSFRVVLLVHAKVQCDLTRWHEDV